ncbi:hypothetical protein ACG74X_16535 [Marivita sp. S0852]|uniref:hypothetical protein n=1 Tax=Marivita sp. S0852 TaxID=3373893 RepID=UPI003982895B
MSMDGPSDALASLSPDPERGVALPRASTLTQRERDYFMLSILVRVQHLRFKEAQVLVDALAEMGEDGPDTEFAQAVIAYRQGDFDTVQSALSRLDRIDPADVTATERGEDRARIRSFMKAKACFALTGALDDEARASLDYYMRRRPGKNADGATQ